MLFYTLSVIFTGLLSLTISQPDGWKMTDRFYGFRYELHGANFDQSILKSIQKEADAYACFGWAQLSPSNTVVGEARCSKARGKIFQDKLKSISPQVTNSEVLVRSSHFYFTDGVFLQ